MRMTDEDGMERMQVGNTGRFVGVKIDPKANTSHQELPMLVIFTEEIEEERKQHVGNSDSLHHSGFGRSQSSKRYKQNTV